MVLTELLIGARGVQERLVIVDLARTVVTLPQSDATWIAAGDVGQAWRAKGRTLSVVDCVLVALARANDVPLWTLDHDFDPVFDAGGIRRATASSAFADQ